MANTIAGRVTGGPGGPTQGSSSRVSEREDLANFISMITRDETPFMSSIGKTKASAIYHEWQTDELQQPGNSRIPEGQDYLAPANDGGAVDTQDPVVGAQFAIRGPNRTRLGNYTQINGKTIAVSGTKRAIDQAGVADEYAYQLKKRGTEMRRDMETDLINTGNVSGFSNNDAQNGNARSTGTVFSWINNSDVVEYAGSGHTAPATEIAGTSAWAPSTSVSNRGALSLADIDQVMQNIYEQGGKASRIMVSPKLRRDFSDLMVTDSGVRRNIDMDGKLRQSVDVYMSDFGDLMVVPNYIMGLDTPGSVTTPSNNTSYKNAAALIYDPQWFAFATLRPMQEVEVGQRGDSTVGMFVEEWSLEVKNPTGCGAIYNLA